MTSASYVVTGMTCDHCVQAVNSELLQLPGVEHVDTDLTTGRVTLESAADLDPDAVRAAVEEAGYELRP